MTKYDFIIHNINEKGERIQTQTIGMNMEKHVVMKVAEWVLDSPDIYRRVFTGEGLGKFNLYPVVLDITEVEGKKYEPHSMHLDKDHKGE